MDHMTQTQDIGHFDFNLANAVDADNAGDGNRLWSGNNVENYLALILTISWQYVNIDDYAGDANSAGDGNGVWSGKACHDCCRHCLHTGEDYYNSGVFVLPGLKLFWFHPCGKF